MQLTPSIFREFIGLEVRRTSYQDLHVLTKLLISFSLSLSILFVRDLPSALALLALSAALCKIAGIPLGAIRKYLVVLASVTSFIAIAFVLFASIPGRVTYFEHTLFRLEAEKGVLEWKILVSDRSLEYTAVFVTRIFSMILSAILLLGSVSDRELVWGLRAAKAPYGLCLAVALFFKGFQAFVSDFFTVRDAMQARGVDFDKMSLLEKFRIYVNALIPLFALLISRSYEISLALEARGISPGSRVSSSYYESRPRGRDYIAIAGAILVVALFYYYSALVAGWIS